LGDTAHLPYGNKSPQTVRQYAIENAAFLMKKNIKLLMIPCHTACCHALKILQETLPIPVIGVIEPGLELLQPMKRVAILGTTSTIESGIYQSLIQKQYPDKLIYAKACPLFVPLIEDGFHNHLSTQLIARSYLEPLKGQIDAALLACTHYPLIRSTLKLALGSNVQLIEPAAKCAEQAFEWLSKAHLLNPQKEKPTYQFFASDDPEKFRQYGQIFLGAHIEKVEKK